ncbi:MAG: hypothetical protein LBL97_00850 [Prevotellaceae bacterium]|jgi:hypothetical protein|nr:hypothetical protein [Prevotellaceae bacterium]
MITKYLKYTAIGLCVLLSSCLTTQKTKDELSDIAGKPLFCTIGKSFFYIREDGSRIKVHSKAGIKFNGDRDSLRHYMNNMFYNSPDYDPDRAEFNYYEYFVLLFDKDLNVIEVRQQKRQYTTSEYYDRIFIDGLKKSKGMWHKTIEGRKWYISIIGYRVF